MFKFCESLLELSAEVIDLNATSVHIGRNHYVVHAFDDFLYSGNLVLEFALQLAGFNAEGSEPFDLDAQQRCVTTIFADGFI